MEEDLVTIKVILNNDPKRTTTGFIPRDFLHHTCSEGELNGTNYDNPSGCRGCSYEKISHRFWYDICHVK